ncbi:hypothetical protein EWM64_g5758 [Hericium alpestre]|uniref:Uncharacterized protein n=1 Tax=Hericium alpestre TaxID=135208 RepID=A0A4Y9ZVH1_9AGAM|nr:hypothetical protein EWM64_g5758 [Hericium alpestre]
MEQLPPEYIVSTKTTCHRPPRLHYCISVTSHQLYDYAVKNHLMPEQYIRDRSHLYCGMDEAVNELEQLSGAMLSLEAPGWSAEDSWLVARYTNYNYSYHMKTGPPDDDVFALIRRELATTATPKWYRVT